MPELNFQVLGARPAATAEPSLLFALRLTEAVRGGIAPAAVQSVALRCQVRIEPARQTYTAREQERLVDLFGTLDRWSQTVRPLLWAHASLVVPAFRGTADIELPVPCRSDVSHAASRYFAALEAGEVPLSFLFSGTVFFTEPDGRSQATPISWDKEAAYRLPAALWQSLLSPHEPPDVWLRHVHDLFAHLRDDRLTPEREATP